MMYLNKNEQRIIEKFMDIENKCGNENLILKWNDVSYVIAKYDSFIEYENDYEIDDELYE